MEQTYYNLVKRLALNDNWKFRVTLTTEIPDIDEWEKKLHVQRSITDNDPVITIALSSTQSDKVYHGELTEEQSTLLSRGNYFVKVIVSKAGEMRTLTDRESKLTIF